MDTLIRTKLQRPAIGPDILPRSQLIERLENGRYRKLTLISAPAGYGKSILGSLWQEVCNCLGAWLTLDKNDNDLGVFLNYFINAIQTLFPESFPETEELLVGQQLPSLDIISTRLVNEAATVGQHFIIVLDDYHVITNQAINQLVGTLVQHLPTHMHLAIITRQDPRLDIINLRAKNQITEIRLAELRFSEAEAQQYLANKLGNTISPDLAHALLERTESWPVGLRLAVLALRNQVDQTDFLQSFQGSNQYIMSYLVNEVLSQQPQSIQTYLLQTSLLDRFCAPLCDAMLLIEESDHPAGSQEILDSLLHDNLFLIPLDHQGEWFRYHHLFQDLLRHQLNSRFSKAIISQLHAKASSWLAGQGFIEEALDHAFLAGDMDQAAQIFTEARFGLMNQTRWQRLEQLLRRFPQNEIDRYPDLLMAEIWLFYQHNQWIKLPPAIDQLERLISQRSQDGKDYRYLVGEMSALRSLLLYYALEIDGVVTHAEQALELTAPELEIVRVLARMSLAGTQQLAGDLNGAYATIYRGFDEEPVQSDALKAAVLVTVCFASWIAADFNTLQQNASQAINLAQKPRSPGMLGFGHYFLGMVAYHQNDLPAAEKHFSFVNQRPYSTYDDSFVYSACGLALTHQAMGREQGALDVIDQATTYLLATGNSDMLLTLQAFQMELAWRQKQFRKASQWAQHLDAPPPMSPMTQFYYPHMTLAKVWLAEDSATSRKKAARLLALLQEFLKVTHNNVHLIETLALQALSLQLAGDESTALKTLEQALIIGLPGKFMRVFIDLGPAMGDLLTRLVVDEPELAGFKRKIIAAMLSAIDEAPPSPDGHNVSQPLPEPLTNRELDVLSLLSQRQSDREIATLLHISPHTVRTHTKNIYAKLGVNNRRQATLRARELGLEP